MKIAFVHQPLGTLSAAVQDGSIAIWVYEVARRLARTNEVIVYARGAPPQKEIETGEGVTFRAVSTELDERLFRFLEERPRLTRLSGLCNPNLPFFALSLAHLEYGVRIAWDIGLQRCDVVHIKNFSQLAPIIKVFNPRTKVVLHLHCEWLTQLDRATIERRLRSCDLVVGCSEHIVKKIRLTFPWLAARCRVIYNGVDADTFCPSNSGHTDNQDGMKRLLFVGRVSPEKGLHLLLEAFKKVVQRRPQTQLTIVGPEWVVPLDYIVALSDEVKVSNLARFYPGSYPAQLRQMLSPDIADRVCFVNNLAHRELPRLYRQADVLVNPSLVEAFGMTLIEGMACRVPVVAARVGGMKEVVEDGKSGLLFDPDDPSALADAILRLLVDDDVRESMGKAGRERALKVFSWDKISERTLELHNQLVNQKESDERTSGNSGYASLQRRAIPEANAGFDSGPDV